MKSTQELIPSLKPVYDRYKSGDIFKSAFGSEQGITSSKFCRRPRAEEEKAKGIIRKFSNPELFFAFNKDAKTFRQHKSTFFNKNPEALTEMAKIISSNPDTWPEVIRNKYGINIDEHFWENNPLLSFGSGIDIHKWIGKLPKPKAGWTPGKYKYMGPYNPLEQQLSYNPETGEVTDWKVKPYNKVDEIAAYHDICYDMGRNKGDCDREMVKSLDDIPYGEMPKWGSTARFLINTKRKLGLGLQKKRESALSNSDWSQQLADELHEPITRNFSKRSVISNGIDEIWAADLVEMQKFSKWNKGVKYLLMLIDVFSKYGWIKPLIDKKTETVKKAFDEIFKSSKRLPKMLWTDEGSEFISKHFKEFLKSKEIKLYHTENEEKSNVVERWNKTMKNRMWKMFTVNNNTIYFDKIDKLVNDYNNARHSSVNSNDSCRSE